MIEHESPLDRTALAKLFAKQIQERFPTAQIALSDEQLLVDYRDRVTPFALAEFETAYRQAPDQLEVLIGNLLSAVHTPPPQRSVVSFESLSQRILPMLKPAQLLKEAQQRGLPQPAHRPFLAGLIITYVIEEPQRLVYLNDEHLQRWDVGEQHLHEIALPNLRRRTTERAKFTLGGDESQPLIIAASGDGFDATRILMPDLLDNWQRHMPGNLLIAIPTRDLLIAFSDDDSEVIERISQQVARDAAAPNGLTDQLFCMTDGELLLYSWE